MKRTLQTSQVLIYDSVLTEADHGALLRYLNTVDYYMVHHNYWQRVWRLNDGLPLTAGAAWYPPSPEKPDQTSYPTHTPLDPLIRAILDLADEVGPVVGTMHSDWARVSFAPWIYPAGTSLSLHADGNSYSGAYTFYAHREWNLHWGGALLVLDEKTLPPNPMLSGETHSFVSDDGEAERALNPGLGTAVMPVPNRLVFVSAGAQHMVQRVDPTAGSHSRVSIAGFFHR